MAGAFEAVGRAAELAALERVTGGTVVVVRGPAGAGKSALLDVVARARPGGVLRIACTPAQPRWDLFGAEAVVGAVRDRFDEIGDSRVAAALAAVNRSCTPHAYRGASTRATLFTELTKLFRCVRERGPATVLFDDVHATPSPELAVAAAQQAGCAVVATCRGGACSVDVVADHTIDLRPLDAPGIGVLIARATGLAVDAAVVPAVCTALGPLAGNPGTVLDVVAALRRDGLLTEFRGHLCLAEPGRPVPLPDRHPLLDAVREHGRPGWAIVALAGTAERLRAAHLLSFAATTGELAAYGRALDRLVAVHALACDPDGVLAVPCPALAESARAALGAHDLRELHAKLAGHLRGALPADPAVPAEHLAAAGTALPADPRTGGLLADQAGRLERTDPATAARWYRAALRHLGPTHPSHAPLLARLLRLLIRIARYDWLADVVADAVAAGGCPLLNFDLAVAAALAALHVGRPVPEPVRRTLGAVPACVPPLEFAARWFDGAVPLCVTEVATIFGPFRADFPLGTWPDPDELIAAGCRYDLVALFGLVLGEEYGEPASGPQAVYRAVAENYHRGDWPAALSAARNLELGGYAVTPAHRISRLFAAEMCSCSGRFEEAAGWLAAAGDEGHAPAMRAWAEAGLLRRSRSLEAGFEAGLRGLDLMSAQATPVGLPWLLSRLAHMAKLMRRDDHLARLAVEARRWRKRYHRTGFGEAELQVRGIATGDYDCLRAAVARYRERGNAVELLRACLQTADVAEDPKPWFDEAYELARALGGDWIRTFVKTTMREHGLHPPRMRAAAEHLSDTEIRVIGLVGRGQTNRQVAATLGISEKTVENHLTRLFAKTGCRSRLDLVTASFEGRLTPAVA